MGEDLDPGFCGCGSASAQNVKGRELAGRERTRVRTAWMPTDLARSTHGAGVVHSPPCSRLTRHSAALAESSVTGKNGTVITLTEPQVWTMLGILAAAFASTIAITTQLMMRTIETQFSSLGERFESVRRELKADIAGTHARIDSTDAKIEGTDAKIVSTHERIEGLRTEMVLRFEEVDRRFARLEKQVDDIDRDVQAISKKVFPE